MNGTLADETLRASWLSSAGRIAGMARNNEKCVQAAFLVGLTRAPTPAELRHFVAQLERAQVNEREEFVEDMIWSLFNSTEFSWNH